MATLKLIELRFDPETLPKWARRYPEVIALARRDLAYRCDVCEVEHTANRRQMIREAKARETATMDHGELIR